MKIDLHTHTKRCKQGDSSKRNIETDKFISKMIDNNISICAITNHNHFDLEEFQNISHAEKSFCIFPGIELDIKFGEFHHHIIVICSPKRDKLFKKVFDNNPDRDYNTHSISYEDLISNVKKFQPNEIILIPHFLDKDKDRAFNAKNKDKLKEDLEDYIIFLEPGNMKSMGIINNHKEISLLGSDVTNWDKYDTYNLPDIKFHITSFEKFMDLAQNPEIFIKQLLLDSNKLDVPIKNSFIPIYQDINIVFGEKGSGKTKLLDEYIYRCFIQSGYKTIFHEGKDYNKLYENIIENGEDALSISEEKKTDLINYFKAILKYTETPPQNFITNLKESHLKELKNNKAKTIKKWKSKFSSNKELIFASFISSIKRDIEKIQIVIQLNTNFERSTENKENLNVELTKLKNDLISYNLDAFKNYFSDNQTEIFLDSIKNSISRQTGSVHQSNNIGFSKLVRSRLERIQNNRHFKNVILEMEDSYTQTLGYLPQKGDISLITKISFLRSSDNWDKFSPYDKNSIVLNRKIVSKIEKFSVSNFQNINNYFESEEIAADPNEFINQTLKKKSLLAIGGNKNYEPSEGEKAILTISSILENSTYNCYIFDEIERGLGNKYVTEYLIPQLKYLRDIGKTVILSTHNSNIAINTLPMNTIYSNYNIQEENIYYIGNMYSNELKGIDNNCSLHWEDKAIIHLEGSHTMFNRRRNIYGI
ncbi:hypothetical protein [Staphylococcus saprophyticus]|uniref:hypothetical protein n=1 Tax=Staphylococcus saprophyticus TaxID=29385 RepID=UPI00289E5C53|nr:hypothetical protein [Staphylococcus saprophyticus]